MFPQWDSMLINYQRDLYSGERGGSEKLDFLKVYFKLKFTKQTKK